MQFIFNIVGNEITPRDLIKDLRSRINHTATQGGTGSYERQLCVAVLEAQANEIDQLRSVIHYLDGTIEEIKSAYKVKQYL